jgi:LPS sulfotransferase NodH
MKQSDSGRVHWFLLCTPVPTRVGVCLRSERVVNTRGLALYHLVRSRPRSSGGARPVSSLPRWSTRETATYLICATPRSGSWLLSDGLRATRVAGNPREWFNVFEEQHRRAQWRMEHASDLTFPAYLHLAREKSTTANRISGVKLHLYQLDELTRKLAPHSPQKNLTPVDALNYMFPRAQFLWLTRRDKISQAISLLTAQQTNVWWMTEPDASPSVNFGRLEPEFDPVAIANLERRLTESDRRWQQIFAARSVDPLAVCYEDLVEDYEQTIRQVLRWLQVPDADRVAVGPPRLRRQADARSQDWAVRYRAYRPQTQPEGTRRGGGGLADLARRAAGHLETATAVVLTGATAGLQRRAITRAVAAELDPTSDGAQPAARFDGRTVDELWHQWVARSVMQGCSDAAVTEVLVRNGFDASHAHAVVAEARSHPYLLGAQRAQRPLRQAVGVLAALGQLGSLDAAHKLVDRRSGLSVEEFRDRYYAANRPVIITDLTAGWKASGWTVQHLATAMGEASVEVMRGRVGNPRYEREPHRHRVSMPFADYVDLVGAGDSNDAYLVANNRFFAHPAAGGLLDELAPVPPYLRPTLTGGNCFLWFGPAATVTPLHRDVCNILFVQLIGRKRWRLIPALQWPYVYNTEGVYSDVDIERPDLTRFPDFHRAQVIDLILEPGSAIFVPVGWWHHVRALGISVSVSFTNFVLPNTFGSE